LVVAGIRQTCKSVLNSHPYIQANGVCYIKKERNQDLLNQGKRANPNSIAWDLSVCKRKPYV
jgi:hypothetical protein